MSPRRRLIPAVLAATAAATLVLAGCSSSGGGSAAPATTPAAGSSAAVVTFPTSVASSSSSATATGEPADSAGGTTTAASSESAAESSTDNSSTATSSVSGGGNKVPAEPAECASITQKYGAVINAILPVLQGKTGSTPFDADQLSRAVKADTMGTIPAEVAPDFAAFATAAEQLRGKDLTAAAGVLNGTAISTATDHIDKFLSDHC